MSLARKVLAHVNRNPIRYAVGGVLALVFGGVYLYRRRAAKQLAGEFGEVTQEFKNAVKAQVNRALEHKPLADYRTAESSKFYGAPLDDREAYYKAAFWLATAARCAQAWSLADMAESYRQKAHVVMGANHRSSILLTAGQAITAAAPTNPGARAAAAALGSLSDPEKLAHVDQAKSDQSVSGKLVGTVKGSAADVSDYAGRAFDAAAMLSNGVRMLIGMDPPPGGPVDAWWNWKKWALRGGVAAAVILGLRVYFAPQYSVAKAFVSKAGTAVQNPVAAIRAALTSGV